MTAEESGKSTTICGIPLKWVLFLVLVAAYMENCDSDTVRQFQHISRARNAAQMAKKKAGGRVPKFKVVRVAQMPVPVMMSGGYSKVSASQQVASPGHLDGQVDMAATTNEMHQPPAPADMPALVGSSGGYSGTFTTPQETPSSGGHHTSSAGGYAATLPDPVFQQVETPASHPSVETAGHGGYGDGQLHLMAMSHHSEHQQKHHNHHEEGLEMAHHGHQHHHKPEHHGWGWKPEKKKKKSKYEKKNPNDIIYSILGITILKLGTTVVLGALSILIFVLAAINITRLTTVSPVSLPLHAFWIGALFLIPFLPLFWLALVLVGTTDILTHLKYKPDEEEEEEHHHGWGHSSGFVAVQQDSGHGGWRRSSPSAKSLNADVPQWLLRKRILQTLKSLPDLDNFEANYS